MARKKPHIEKRQIIKSNNLIESSYKLTISENRLIDLALTKLEVEMLDKDLSAEDVKKLIKTQSFDEIEINVLDYKNEYGIKNNSIYTDLSSSANRLYNRSIIYFESNDLVTKRWVITCKYKEDNCAVAIQFHPDLIPDLMVFKGCYTKFDFDVKKYIKSFYTCKIYELLKQYEAYGQRTFYVDQLRFLLGIEDNEYPEYANLKQKVIKPSVKQISDITDLYCEFEEIKNKRKVEKIKFRFVCQPVNFQHKEQLSFLSDEVAMGSQHDEYNIVKEFREILGITISPRQIDKIVGLASESIKKYNLNMTIKQYIKQKKIVVDEYGKKTKIESYLGILIKAIQGNWTMTVKEPIEDSFNSYQQRQYNYGKLEDALRNGLNDNNKDYCEGEK